MQKLASGCNHCSVENFFEEAMNSMNPTKDEGGFLTNLKWLGSMRMKMRNTRKKKQITLAGKW